MQTGTSMILSWNGLKNIPENRGPIIYLCGFLPIILESKGKEKESAIVFCCPTKKTNEKGQKKLPHKFREMALYSMKKWQ